MNFSGAVFSKNHFGKLSLSKLNNNNNDKNNHSQRCYSRFFFLQSPHCAVNRLQHVRLSGPGAIVCKSHATHQALITCSMSFYVPHSRKGQLSY